MKSLTIVLANTPIFNGNRGCVALSITSIYLIDRILSEAHVNYQLYVLDTLIKQDKYSVCLPDKKIVIYPISYPVGVGFKDWVKLLADVPHLIQSIRVLCQSDIIFDIGQGDSFADIYGKRRFQVIDRIHRIASFFKKKYCFLPQTIGPFTDTRLSDRAGKSLRKASFVMVRDKLSLDYVKELVPTKIHVREYLDVAFFLPYQKITFDSHFIHVGLNISALLWNGGYTQNNQFGLKDDYVKSIKMIMDYFISIEHVVLHLVPHVLSQERGIENDYGVAYDLWQEYNCNHVVLAPFFLGPVEAKSYIAGLDFFIGARMHSTIAAFSTGVPVIPMAYSRKFAGLYNETLDYHYTVDLKTMTNTQILSVIKDSFSVRSSIHDLISERLKGVVSERKKDLMASIQSELLSVSDEK